jgi:AraC-like DNA-binding protein
MRISDIAYACVFADLSYFNRTFKHRFGETPRFYRG